MDVAISSVQKEMIGIAHYFLYEAPIREDESAGYEFRLKCDLTMSWRGEPDRSKSDYAGG